MIKKILIGAVVILSSLAASAKGPGFAIVIDSASLREAKSEINEYVKAIEDMQGMHVFTLVDRWGVPDSIRTELKKMHECKDFPIVGCVFIGDIPVPMIRDAQHMSSAFKMDQSMPWEDSSIPSDRFYDDFDLTFRFIKKDSVHTNFFYYSLTAEGEQYLEPDIFSGRIKPSGRDKYEKLREYLRKAVRAKLNPEEVGSFLIYSGSGSLSESPTAAIDELASLKSHFPQLTGRPDAFRHLSFGDAPYIKEKLMNELMRPDLSISVLHHHGDFDTQYLDSHPKPSGLAEAKDYLLFLCKNRLNNYVRYGMPLDTAKAKLVRDSGIPEEWISGLTEKDLSDADSLDADRLNLTLKDFAQFGFRPECRLVLFDACYNAAFSNDDFIANEYIFQPGATMVGIGGSVNVLQDKWPDHLVGLMADGMMVGFLNQYTPDMEMHVIGDPTFVFKSNGNRKGDINKEIVSMSGKQWAKAALSDSEPDFQCLALEKLRRSDAISDSKLLNLMKTSKSEIVRLQAFLNIKSRGYSDAYAEALRLAAHDSYEMLQRFSVNGMQNCGDPELMDDYADFLAANSVSARVGFNAAQGVQLLDSAKIMRAVAEKLDSMRGHVVNWEAYRREKIDNVRHYAARWDSDIDELCSGKMSRKNQLRYASYLRLYLPAHKVDEVVEFTRGLDDAELKKAFLETLGWHGEAYTKASIESLARELHDDPDQAPEVRQEALKTLKRINNLR